MLLITEWMSWAAYQFLRGDIVDNIVANEWISVVEEYVAVGW
jgi:hypothetical protein